jgi:hypothetical protein
MNTPAPNAPKPPESAHRRRGTAMRRFPRHKTGPDTTRVHRENGFPEGLKRRFFNFTKCCRWNASSASGTRTAQSRLKPLKGGRAVVRPSAPTPRTEQDLSFSEQGVAADGHHMMTATHESRRSPFSPRVASPSGPASEPWPRHSHSAGTTAGNHTRQGCGVMVARYVLSLSVAVVSEKNDVNVVPIELRPT